MRPIDRGAAPKVYTRYGDAINDLEDRLDYYCSYCERRLPAGLEVEHISPKSKDPAKLLDWQNFLLGCKNCNGVKGALPEPDRVDDYLWPDKDNTLRAIRYGDGGMVAAQGNVGTDGQTKAERLMDLVGLDRYPGHPNGKVPTNRDKRYSQREEIWATATKLKNSLVSNDCEERRQDIIQMARGWGFFSVWMTVFENDSDMRRRLIDGFKGTALDCFDAVGTCITRPGGSV